MPRRIRAVRAKQTLQDRRGSSSAIAAMTAQGMFWRCCRRCGTTSGRPDFQGHGEHSFWRGLPRVHQARAHDVLGDAGRHWKGLADHPGSRAQDATSGQSGDPLRLEVTTALKNERIRVIPVLVDRGVMPNREDLPADLAGLHFRNALELSDTRWESDVQRLIQAIEEASPAPARRPKARSPLAGVCKPLEPSCRSSITSHTRSS